MSEAKLLVAATDFGSYGAGYAFSFSYQFKANPIDVQTSIWSSNNSATTSKIPCVHIEPSNILFVRRFLLYFFS